MAQEKTFYLNPYLAFDGKCRDAMTFYKDYLGGELTMQTNGESPMAAQFPPEAKNNIMHSSLTKDGVVLLMASDMADPNDIKNKGKISLSLNCTSKDQIEIMYSKLSAGGKVLHPLKEEFWGGIFGQLTDKFGIDWMLNYDKQK